MKPVTQIIKNTLWVHYNGRTFSVDAQPQGRKSRKGAAGPASDEVAAPMPGKLTKILVTEGQELEKGQAVLVMEAMKMEYTLKSEVAGKVQKIHAQVGEQVALGKLLVKMEAKS